MFILTELNVCLLKICLELTFNFCNLVGATAPRRMFCSFILCFSVLASFELQHGMLILLLQRITNMLRL